jgi:hypothetical protein
MIERAQAECRVSKRSKVKKKMSEQGPGTLYGITIGNLGEVRWVEFGAL